MTDLLDIRTLSILTGFILFTSAALLVANSLQHRNIKGPGLWAFAECLAASGLMLIFARNQIPDYVSITVANGLIFIGNMILVHGVCVFLGRKTYWPPMLLLFALSWGAYNFLYVSSEYILYRIYISDIHSAIYLGISSYLILSDWFKNRGAARLTAGFAFMLNALLPAMRSFWLIIDGSQINTSLPTGTSTYYFYIGLCLGVFAFTVGLIMLVAERLQKDLAFALEKERYLKKEQNNFWAMVSHEFRRPLGTIYSSAQLLQHFKNEEKKQSETETLRIQNAASRLSHLVDKCIVNNWLEEEKKINNKIDFDISNELKKLAFEYDIEIKNDIAHNTKISGDPNFISVAISSLIDNALKYCADKTSVELSASDIGDDNISVSIFDDGPGVLPNETDKIFEKFYRAPDQLNQQGSGIGLYMVRRIAHLHDGNVVYKKENKTCFTITLPISK